MRLLLLVVAWHYQLVYLLAERSPQEGDDLCTGADGVGTEGRICRALGDTFFDSPHYCLL